MTLDKLSNEEVREKLVDEIREAVIRCGGMAASPILADAILFRFDVAEKQPRYYVDRCVDSWYVRDRESNPTGDWNTACLYASEARARYLCDALNEGRVK